MEGVAGGLKCLLLGARDSVLGTRQVYLLAKRSEAIRKQILQCFLLNGIILGLSILLFDYAFLPLVQLIASFIYSIIGDPSKSGVMTSMGTVLWYIFTGFWVLPIFWISKPINSIWFQDIASTTFRVTKKQEIKKRSKKSPRESLSMGQSISRLIADLLFSVVLELLFLIQCTLVGLLPGIGWILSLLHLAILYALYTFEYKWINEGWAVHKRVFYIENNWPYFLGFGMPLAILTSLSSSIFTSACIFGVLFPIFLVSANFATPIKSTLSPVPIFKVVVLLSNKLFHRRTIITSGSTHSISNTARPNPSNTSPAPYPSSFKTTH